MGEYMIHNIFVKNKLLLFFVLLTIVFSSSFCLSFGTLQQNMTTTSPNVCEGYMNNMRVSVYPCTAHDIDSKDITQYVNFTWEGSDSLNTDWIFTYEGSLETGSMYYWNNDEWVDYTQNVQYMGNDLLGNGYEYYKVSSKVFTPDETVRTKWVYTPENHSSSGKWHIFGKRNSKGISESVQDNEYFYLDPWWDSGWKYKKKINISHDKIDSELTDFVVLVHLNSSNIDWNKFQSNGEDLRFTNSDEDTELSFEIEEWNDENDAWVWVQVPTIISSVDTTIYMYYGNSDAVNGEDVSGTWNASIFGGVWHLTDLSDSTTNNNAFTNDGPNPTTGKIGGGYVFDGTDDKMSVTINTDSWTEISAEAFFYSHDGSADQYVFASDEDSGWGKQSYIRVKTDTDEIITSYGDGSGMKSAVYDTSSINANTWYHVIGVAKESDDVDISVNSTLTDGEAISSFGDVSNTKKLGVYGAADNSWFEGVVDEVRLYKVKLSSAWQSAEYSNVNEELLVFNAEESIPVINEVNASSSVYEGYDVSWSVNWTYSDGDYARLFVCKTDSFNNGCLGSSWCSTDSYENKNPLVCNHTSTSDDVGDNYYYVFIESNDTFVSASSDGNFSVSRVDIVFDNSSSYFFKQGSSQNLTFCSYANFSSKSSLGSELGWWKIKTGTGSIISDYGSGGNDGTLSISEDYWWRLNEGSGTAVEDYGSMTDSDGTLANSDNWSTGGKVWDDTYSFDGDDDYIDAGGVSIGDGSFSVCIWAKTSDLSVQRYMVSSRTDDEKFLLAHAVNGKFVWKIYNGSYQTVVTSIVGLDEWHHVCGIYDEENDRIMIYLDGEHEDTLENIGDVDDFDIDGIGSFRMGNGVYDGLLQDVRVYKYALYSTEVSRLYNSGDGTTSSVGWSDDGKVWSNAYTFNGRDDYVKISNSFDGGSAFTITSWFKTDTLEDQDAIVVQDPLNSYKFIHGYGNNLKAYVRQASGTSNTAGISGYDDGEWHLLVTTFNQSLDSDRLKVYVDGGLEETANAYDEPITTSVGDLYVGTKYNSLTNGFNGSIHEFRVYNRTLNSTEINDLYTDSLVQTNNELVFNSTSLQEDNTIMNTSTNNCKYITLTNISFNNINNTYTVWDYYNTDTNTSRYVYISPMTKININQNNTQLIDGDTLLITQNPDNTTNMNDFTINRWLNLTNPETHENNNLLTTTLSRTDITGWNQTRNIMSNLTLTIEGESLYYYNTTESATWYKKQIDDCSTFTTTAYNITLKNEETDEIIWGHIEDVLFEMTTTTGTNSYANFSKNNITSFTICTYPSWTSFNIDAKFLYEGENLTTGKRAYYIRNGTADNTTNNISVYLLASSIDDTINFNIKDCSAQSYSDVYLDIQREYDNVFKTVTMCKTNINGECNTYIDFEDTPYRIYFYSSSGSLLGTTDSQTFISPTETKIFTVCDSTIDYYWTKYGTISAQATYNTNTHNFTVTITDSTGESNDLTLMVKSSQLTNPTVCEETASGATITLSCTLQNGYVNRIRVTADKDSYTYLIYSDSKDLSTHYDFGSDGIWSTFLIVGGLISMSLVFHNVFITLSSALFGFTISWLAGFMSITSDIFVGGIIFLVFGVLIIGVLIRR